MQQQMKTKVRVPDGSELFENIDNPLEILSKPVRGLEIVMGKQTGNRDAQGKKSG
ncbi:MAG: hypothetical protein ACYTXA_12020 [Nostoc sp.]